MSGLVQAKNTFLSAPFLPAPSWEIYSSSEHGLSGIGQAPHLLFCFQEDLHARITVLLPGGPARKDHHYCFIPDRERQDRLPGGFLKLLP